MARFAFTTRELGDFHIGGDPADLEHRRRGVFDAPWTWLRQVHGARVVTVTEPGEHAGAEADAAVTAVPGAVLAIHTADCVPVMLHDRRSAVLGAAHVGWRGLVGGVLESTVEAMARLGATDIRATAGPHIRARCYEFGAAELDQVAARYGDAVRAETAWGTPALDLLAGIRAALGGRTVEDAGGCTACEPERYFSHRARGDAGRHAAACELGTFLGWEDVA